VRAAVGDAVYLLKQNPITLGGIGLIIVIALAGLAARTFGRGCSGAPGLT
jgi:hypothetical protein